MTVEIANLGVGSRVKHPAFGVGVVIRLHKIAYDICFVQYGVKEVGKNYDSLEVIEGIEPEQSVSFSEAEQSLIRILKTYTAIDEVIPLGDKWNNGKLVLQPEDSSMQNKEIPISTFFHKIVMVRDRLRVMEQRINSSKSMTDEEKVNLQQYLTRIYGSLTSFNVLFKSKDHHFKGDSSKA